MANDVESLEQNPFFNLLRYNYRNDFLWAHVKNGVILIPESQSLYGIRLDKKFTEKHIFHPMSDDNTSNYIGKDTVSWFFKEEPKIYIHDGKIIETIKGYKERKFSKILVTHYGFNKFGDRFLIHVLDRPLHSKMGETKIPNNILDFQEIDCTLLTYNSTKEFFDQFEACDIVKEEIDIDIDEFLMLNHLDASNLEKSITKIKFFQRKACQIFLGSISPMNRPFMSLVTNQAYESHVLGRTYFSVFTAVKEFLKTRDDQIAMKIEKLSPITLARLGVDPLFDTVQLAPAIKKLGELDSCVCILSKMNCINEVVNLITKEIEIKTKKKQTKNFLKVIDYLPLMAYCIGRQEKHYVYSHMYFMDKLQCCTKTYDSLWYSYSIYIASFNFFMKLSGPIIKEEKSPLDFFGSFGDNKEKKADNLENFPSTMSNTEMLIRSHVNRRRAELDEQTAAIQRVISGMMQRQAQLRQQEGFNTNAILKEEIAEKAEAVQDALRFELAKRESKNLSKEEVKDEIEAEKADAKEDISMVADDVAGKGVKEAKNVPSEGSANEDSKGKENTKVAKRVKIIEE